MSATISTTASPHKAHKIHASLRCSRFTTPFTAFWERSSTVPRSDDELVKTAAPHEGDSGMESSSVLNELGLPALGPDASRPMPTLRDKKAHGLIMVESFHLLALANYLKWKRAKFNVFSRPIFRAVIFSRRGTSAEANI
ncbi:hypothetical protein TWF103_002430 [Orbilia oligospora]|nr:hypothetical protein TWF103_002430 [Orbilia oligospora]